MTKDCKKKEILKKVISKSKDGKGGTDLQVSRKITPLERIKGSGVKLGQMNEQAASGKKAPYLTDNIYGAIDKANLLSGKPTNMNTVERSGELPQEINLPKPKVRTVGSAPVRVGFKEKTKEAIKTVGNTLKKGVDTVKKEINSTKKSAFPLPLDPRMKDSVTFSKATPKKKYPNLV